MRNWILSLFRYWHGTESLLFQRDLYTARRRRRVWALWTDNVCSSSLVGVPVPEHFLPKLRVLAYRGCCSPRVESVGSWGAKSGGIGVTRVTRPYCCSSKTSARETLREFLVRASEHGNHVKTYGKETISRRSGTAISSPPAHRLALCVGCITSTCETPLIARRVSFVACTTGST